MSGTEADRWMAVAWQQAEAGSTDSLIDTLRRALAADPELPEAHALLALALVDANRLHAADHEAATACRLAPDLALAHLARGRAAILRHRPKEARQAFEHVLELEPESVAALLGLADVLRLSGGRDEAGRVLERARALDPEDADVHVALGHWHLARGRFDAAEQAATEALRLAPEDPDALLLRGWIHLERGDVDAARDHAAWALGKSAGGREAIRLIVATKARRSRLLGAWWRWNSWMETLGDGRGVLVLLAAFAAVQVGRLALGDLGLPAAAGILQLAWLGLVIYSWLGPAAFQRMMKRELDKVRLRADF